MCGIAGIVFKQNQQKTSFDFSAALTLLYHRGPDASGIYSDQKVCLGHQRLSIIDPHENANQPFEDEQHVLTFNGEIYNYPSLRKDIEALGIEFKTDSDTEVLFHLLKKEGEKSLQKLEGCYAFAFYTKASGRLLLARDPFGINPLYFTDGPSGFFFSSEIRSIFQLKQKIEIDLKSLRSYFDLSYIPAPYSIDHTIKKLEPGHYLLLNKGVLRRERFHEINRNRSSMSFEDAKKGLRKHLTDAVEKRLVSDVPIGAFLSGGIDSSIISAIAAQHVQSLSTFSIGFEDADFFDETRYAEEVAKKIGSDHQTIRLSKEDLIESAKQILDHIDEPFADSSSIAVNLLSREVRKHITVALSGDGADEVFSGYNKHKAENFLLSNSSLIGALKFLPRFRHTSRDGFIHNLLRQLNKLKAGLHSDKSQRYRKWLYQLNFSNELILEHNLALEEIIPSIEINEFNDILYYDCQFILSNDMLYKVDMCSMKNSLEVRTPFLDKQLVDFAFSLPADYKIKGTRTKIILREAFKNELPQSVFNRGKKGFEIPLKEILTTGLQDEMNELLYPQFTKDQNLFDFEYIARLMKMLNSNKPQNAAQQVWSLLVFQKFYTKYQELL